jgi:hypothetical protein
VVAVVYTMLSPGTYRNVNRTLFSRRGRIYSLIRAYRDPLSLPSVVAELRRRLYLMNEPTTEIGGEV